MRERERILMRRSNVGPAKPDVAAAALPRTGLTPLPVPKSLSAWQRPIRSQSSCRSHDRQRGGKAKARNLPPARGPEYRDRQLNRHAPASRGFVETGKPASRVICRKVRQLSTEAPARRRHGTKGRRGLQAPGRKHAGWPRHRRPRRKPPRDAQHRSKAPHGPRTGRRRTWLGRACCSIRGPHHSNTFTHAGRSAIPGSG